MTTQEKLQKLQSIALRTGEFDSLEFFFQTPEYKALPYVVRNEGFITSHKLKSFLRCPWCYEKKYIKREIDRTEKNDKDAFVVGQAFDDFITEGPDYFTNKYQSVKIRNAKAKDANEGKVLLTPSINQTVHKLTAEFRQNQSFAQNPRKKILFFKIANDTILKIEMDGFDKEKALIIDLKTIASIVDAKPEDYLFQMAFYAFVVREVLGIRCEAEIQLVDKYEHFSRSRAFRFSFLTLEDKFGEIITGIDDLRKATELGFFPARKNETFADQKILWTCPFYGIDGHGRETKPIYY